MVTPRPPTNKAEAERVIPSKQGRLGGQGEVPSKGSPKLNKMGFFRRKLKQTKSNGAKSSGKPVNSSANVGAPSVVPTASLLPREPAAQEQKSSKRKETVTAIPGKLVDPLRVYSGLTMERLDSASTQSSMPSLIYDEDSTLISTLTGPSDGTHNLIPFALFKRGDRVDSTPFIGCGVWDIVGCSAETKARVNSRNRDPGFDNEKRTSKFRRNFSLDDNVSDHDDTTSYSGQLSQSADGTESMESSTLVSSWTSVPEKEPAKSPPALAFCGAIPDSTLRQPSDITRLHFAKSQSLCVAELMEKDRRPCEMAALDINSVAADARESVHSDRRKQVDSDSRQSNSTTTRVDDGSQGLDSILGKLESSARNRRIKQDAVERELMKSQADFKAPPGGKSLDRDSLLRAPVAVRTAMTEAKLEKQVKRARPTLVPNPFKSLLRKPQVEQNIQSLSDSPKKLTHEMPIEAAKSIRGVRVPGIMSPDDYLLSFDLVGDEYLEENENELVLLVLPSELEKVEDLKDRNDTQVKSSRTPLDAKAPSQPSEPVMHSVHARSQSAKRASSAPKQRNVSQKSFRTLTPQRQRQPHKIEGSEPLQNPRVVETGGNVHDNEARQAQYRPPLITATSCKPPTPHPLRPEWKAVVDKKSGRVYYYHRATRATTWEKPPDSERSTAELGAVKSIERVLSGYSTPSQKSGDIVLVGAKPHTSLAAAKRASAKTGAKYHLTPKAVDSTGSSPTTSPVRKPLTSSSHSDITKMEQQAELLVDTIGKATYETSLKPPSSTSKVPNVSALGASFQKGSDPNLPDAKQGLISIPLSGPPLPRGQQERNPSYFADSGKEQGRGADGEVQDIPKTGPKTIEKAIGGLTSNRKVRSDFAYSKGQQTGGTGAYHERPDGRVTMLTTRQGYTIEISPSLVTDDREHAVGLMTDKGYPIELSSLSDLTKIGMLVGGMTNAEPSAHDSTPYKQYIERLTRHVATVAHKSFSTPFIADVQQHHDTNEQAFSHDNAKIMLETHDTLAERNNISSTEGSFPKKSFHREVASDVLSSSGFEIVLEDKSAYVNEARPTPPQLSLNGTTKGMGSSGDVVATPNDEEMEARTEAGNRLKNLLKNEKDKKRLVKEEGECDVRSSFGFEIVLEENELIGNQTHSCLNSKTELQSPKTVKDMGIGVSDKSLCKEGAKLTSDRDTILPNSAEERNVARGLQSIDNVPTEILTQQTSSMGSGKREDSTTDLESPANEVPDSESLLSDGIREINALREEIALATDTTRTKEAIFDLKEKILALKAQFESMKRLEGFPTGDVRATNYSFDISRGPSVDEGAPEGESVLFPTTMAMLASTLANLDDQSVEATLADMVTFDILSKCTATPEVKKSRSSDRGRTSSPDNSVEGALIRPPVIKGAPTILPHKNRGWASTLLDGVAQLSTGLFEASLPAARARVSGEWAAWSDAAWVEAIKKQQVAAASKGNNGSNKPLTPPPSSTATPPVSCLNPRTTSIGANAPFSQCEQVMVIYNADGEAALDPSSAQSI